MENSLFTPDYKIYIQRDDYSNNLIASSNDKKKSQHIEIDILNKEWLFNALWKDQHLLSNTVSQEPINQAKASCVSKIYTFINTLRPRRNIRHFADAIFQCIFLEWKCVHFA